MIRAAIFARLAKDNGKPSKTVLGSNGERTFNHSLHNVQSKPEAIDKYLMKKILINSLILMRASSKWNNVVAAVAAAGLVCGGTGSRVYAGSAKIVVDADKPGIKVSPTLYGIFFEEISRAGDGGIYAELLQNRSFEDAPTPNAWTLVKGVGAEGTMALDKSKPLNGNNPTALKLQVSSAAGGRVGVANEGF